MNRKKGFCINLRIVALVVIGLLAIFGVKMLELNGLRASESALAARLREKESEISGSQKALEYYLSDAYVERRARADLNMFYHGERVLRAQQ